MDARVAATAVLSLVLASCNARPIAEQRAPIPPPGPATPKGIEAGDVDRTIDPCTDFYAYGTGAWRAAHPIPDGKPKWSRRAAAREANHAQVIALVQAAAATSGAPAGSAAQIVGDFYAACTDAPAVEAAGTAPLAALAAELDGAKTAADVQRIIRRLHDLGIAAPFGETAAYDNLAPDQFRLDLVAGGLGLPDRDAYLKDDAAAAAARAAYRQRVARVLALAGTPVADSGAAADRVIALETALAAASLDAATAADPAATEHVVSVAQLIALAPHVDWAAYLDEAKLPRAPVNVAEPDFLREVDHQLATAPVATWKDYLRWHLYAAASPWLPATFADDATAAAPRADRCADAAATLFGEEVGHLYADRYFPPSAKARAQMIARDLAVVMKADLAALPWMAAGTRQAALDKLAWMNIQIGYPDAWRDGSALHVRRDGLWADVAQARALAVDELRRQVGQPTRHDGWLLAPWSPDAYLDPQLDELVLPAGFLQPPYFDPGATDAVNYGAFGAGLAHDMTHAFDATGAAIDASGRARDWWSEADHAEFARRARCVVDQYQGYAIEPGVHLDGQRVLAEALGDQSGLHFAYLALQRAIARRPAPTVDGFTPAQQFFLAWAQVRGEAMRIETERQIVAGDPHPVPRFRVNGPMANLAEFEQAFACKPGAPMMRPAADRCAVW